MDEEHGKGKGKLFTGFKRWIVILAAGIIIGAYFAPTLEPWTNAEWSKLIENSTSIEAQNRLLKQQVDCLVNGINLNHGKTTITDCT